MEERLPPSTSRGVCVCVCVCVFVCVSMGDQHQKGELEREHE